MQHGFRKGRSTTTAVLDLVGRVMRAFEGKESVLLTLCDLSKAFDCVPHNILVNKLERYGINSVVLQTIKSYLSGRMQRVSIRGAVSEAQQVCHGVPQGSVLGPLLFLVLINDLNIDDNILLFADDTTLLTKSHDVGSIAADSEELFCRVRLWFQRNKLQLNQDKTQHLLCSLSQAVTPENEMVKLLGFTLDTKLTWEQHVTTVCRRLSRVLFLLRRLQKLVPQPFLVTVYYALFHSHICYGLLLWGHASGCQRVLLLQKAAVRILSSAGYLDHCRPLFSRLKIHTVVNQYILVSLVFIKDHEEEYIRRVELHHHNVRSRNNFDIPRRRLQRTSRSFPDIAVRMFNRLPQEIKVLPIKLFESTVSTWLYRNPFYELEEYFDDSFAGLLSSVPPSC